MCPCPTWRGIVHTRDFINRNDVVGRSNRHLNKETVGGSFSKRNVYPAPPTTALLRHRSCSYSLTFQSQLPVTEIAKENENPNAKIRAQDPPLPSVLHRVSHSTRRRRSSDSFQIEAREVREDFRFRKLELQ